MEIKPRSSSMVFARQIVARHYHSRPPSHKSGPRKSSDLSKVHPALTRGIAAPKWRHSLKSAQIPSLRREGGAVAQLGERLVRNEEVRGSNPLGSTTRLRQGFGEQGLQRGVFAEAR